MTVKVFSNPERSSSPPPRHGLVFDLLLVFMLLAGVYFRVTGLFWGENQYLHPDERFLIWVGTDITPVKCLEEGIPANTCPEDKKAWMSLREYFDTANSTLNPANRGHTFYVYGTLPMFLARYAVEWVYGHSGFQEMTEIGRALSALADVLVVLLVYLVAKKLYDHRVGLLAAAFSAGAVMQIQQSHFFTMDNFINLFTWLAFFIAVRVMVDRRRWTVEASRSTSEDRERAAQTSLEKGLLGDGLPLGFDATRNPEYATGHTAGPTLQLSGVTSQAVRFILHPLFLPSLAFGLALGMAVASKLNAAPMALALPAALAIRLVSFPPEERWSRALEAFGYLVLAAVVSLLAFRVFQPYAFNGPGFFDLKPDPQWLSNLSQLRAQSTGDVDFPPAMQWARRPVWFSAKNLVLWGLGLPLGILAWSGFIWAGWQMLRGNWRRHALLWGWTGFYFIWQSLALNPTMRYQLPIYPALAIFAGWAVVELWDRRRRKKVEPYSAEEAAKLSTIPPASFFTGRRAGVLAFIIGGSVLLATFAWAYAFSRIYTRPITRVEATRWIYQNIAGPINLRIQTNEGDYNQPLSFPYGFTITPGVPYQISFRPNITGTLSEVHLPHVIDQLADGSQKSVNLTISALPNGEQPLAAATLSADFSATRHPRGDGYSFALDRPVSMLEGQTYYLRLELPGEPAVFALNGELSLRIQSFTGEPVDQFLEDSLFVVAPNTPYQVNFSPSTAGSVTGLYVANSSDQVDALDSGRLLLSLTVPGEEDELLEAELVPQPGEDGQGVFLSLLDPIPVQPGENYQIMLVVQPQGGVISLSGDGIANEGDWDDGLPLRMDGYDGFGGIYPLDLNFNMYWEDTPEKLERFTRIMDQADTILITSSRQWGSLPRLSERFPMTTLYYRHLLGCPAERVIEWCYNVAKPGMFQSSLGFELIETFQSDPAIGPLRINDQFAEEAFTVYDHPKVFVFRKTDAYDPHQVSAILGSVDFSQVVHVLPMKAGPYPANLLLPSYRLVEQRLGGTWSALFDSQAIHNQFQVLSVLVWYLSVGLLGLFVYPAVRLALPGLSDRGYPLARTAGLLLLSYLVWLAGSFRVPATRLTITGVLFLIALVGGYLAFKQRSELRQEWRVRRKYFLAVEGLFLAFFLLNLLIRLGNPDLWHPFKGGEKPMDFAYFNAILKSTSFPPYDPWFTGGYLNYYYFGFVFVGILVKWLGIVPAIAYNLILPTLFSLIALGAFSIAWNIYAATKQPGAATDQPPDNTATGIEKPQFLVGLAAALGMAVLGNLGTVRMLYQGYQRLAAPGGVIDEGGILTRLVWAIRGFVMTLSGTPLPYSIGDWYWIPSRAIPAQGDVEPITEFPFFTVLYGDPHAHLFALPITLLALSFALAVVLGRGRWNGFLGGLAGFLLGGLAIGALRPTNTWDFYPYLALGVVALGYTLFSYFQPSRRMVRLLPFLETMPAAGQKSLAAGAGVLLLVGLANLLYQPYMQWYGLGYGKVDLWTGTHTPLDAYFTHWGLFLFLIVSWMAWETRDWMANTPFSSLGKLKPYIRLIQGSLLLLLLAFVGLLWLQVSITWVALPLAAWAGVLLLRPNLPDAKRCVLFLVGTGLVLTLFVEVFVLRGDIGRMNTVFKFYLQVWTLFAVSAAAALGWILLALAGWLPSWRKAWQVVLAVLVAGATLYPLSAGMAKMRDRMEPEAPHTLDGMAYMAYAQYNWEGVMDLSQDYRAIRWMQENVPGSPVIVEGNPPGQYHWGARFSIYTGLPSVVGWQWHQQQQRALVPSTWISSRVEEVAQFYTTTDLSQAQSFLRKYEVRYIVVGQLERNLYPGPGLEKFSQTGGGLWRAVYQEGNTTIYEVIDAFRS